MDSESAETEATSERAERLANLLTLSYEPMLMWRLHGAIEFWNAGAERLYGFSPQEAVGRSSHSLLQTKFPIDFAELQSQLRSERYWSGELRHVRKDGNEVVVDSRMQLLGADTVLDAMSRRSKRSAPGKQRCCTIIWRPPPSSGRSSTSRAFLPASWTCKAACWK